MTWAITLLFLSFTIGIIFSSFTLNGFYVFLLILFVIIIINYASANIWNIRYENDFLIIENIYNTRIVPIDQFKEIKMTSVFNNLYTLFLHGGKKYQFRIRLTNDMSLFFKKDPQFYAKKMTKVLNDAKKEHHE